MVKGSKMPIEKNAEKRETVFITPVNGTHAVLFYNSILDKHHAQKLKDEIQKSGFNVELVKVDKGRGFADRFALSFNGTEYRGEKVNYFYDNYAVLRVYKEIPQVYFKELKDYLSNAGLRIVIDYSEIVAPTLYYKGRSIVITTSVLEESDRHGKDEIERLLRS